MTAMTTANVESCVPRPRTDADIARDVETGLRWCTAEPEGAIKVRVEAGWVTLSGSVDSALQKQAAADSLRYLLGVTGVSDLITTDVRGAEVVTHGVTR
jgi:osmotically-inducible protein OsmY